MNASSTDKLPLGTTPLYAGMHRGLKWGLFVCLTALVIEGAFSAPLMAMWYGWPTLSFHEICNELQKIRFADESRECIYPYPLFGPAEGAGQKTAQDAWGIQPTPKYKRIGYRDLIKIRDERVARQAAAKQAKGAPVTPDPAP